MLTDYYILI